MASLTSSEKIENLDGCLELKHLDVSSNMISKIENLSTLQSLESLIMKKNLLSKADSIQNLVHMKSLRELDLSKNKINCSPESILVILSKCKCLRKLSLKGNPVAKMKHFRKLIISRCKKLTHLDGGPICKEERRRCNVWGKAVLKGASYDEADAASLQELEKIRSEQSEANAEKRRLNGDGNSVSSNNSKAISASVLENVKRAFGLIESKARYPSSYISVSSRRNRDLTEELEQARSIVESQRHEIVHLREQLGQKESKDIEDTLHTLESIIGVGNNNTTTTDDSERDTSYSLETNEKMARRASLKEMQQVVADIKQTVPSESKRRATDTAKKPSTSHQSNNGIQDFDVFSIMPPIPPQHATFT